MPVKYDISNVLWKNNLISGKISSNKDALLAVNSQYFPGWNAYVDGKRVPIFRANYLFQGIKVTKGEHAIEFKYIPISLILGSLFSIFWRRMFRLELSEAELIILKLIEMN